MNKKASKSKKSKKRRPAGRVQEIVIQVPAEYGLTGDQIAALEDAYEAKFVEIRAAAAGISPLITVAPPINTTVRTEIV